MSRIDEVDNDRSSKEFSPLILISIVATIKKIKKAILINSLYDKMMFI
ncbi:MAG: hypothetical protein ACXVNR_01690 [Bacteroidia bacterium]